MNFNEVKNERAIELLADMFDPILEIASDEKVMKSAREGNKILTVKTILKDHSRAVFELMALSENIPVEEYECNIVTLPAKILELFSQPEFEFLFQSQGQKVENISSGSATENIKAEEK